MNFSEERQLGTRCPCGHLCIYYDSCLADLRQAISPGEGPEAALGWPEECPMPTPKARLVVGTVEPAHRPDLAHGPAGAGLTPPAPDMLAAAARTARSAANLAWRFLGA